MRLEPDREMFDVSYGSACLDENLENLLQLVYTVINV